jgi:hypothetical protein
MKKLNDLLTPVNIDQLKMNLRIHPLLDELGAETVEWAMQECIAREQCGQEISPPKTSKPVAEETILEEHVSFLLEHALGFSQDERAERLASIIRPILERDKYRVYRQVFHDYINQNRKW